MLGDPRLPQRFWDKVIPEPNTGCWLWTGYINPYGYGQISMGGRAGRPIVAHRVAYGALVGPIPAGLELDHVRARGCGVRSCVNPVHLEVVTSAENTRRGNAGKATGDKKRARTHCPHGHPFSGDNLVLNERQRFCRECRNKASREYQRRKRAAQLQTKNESLFADENRDGIT